MNTHDFYFDLPKDQIAQRPTQPRDHSRLLHLDKSTGAVSHHHFYDLPSLLKPGDALIINDSRVLPARLYGVSADTGAPIEFLLLQEKEKDIWEILCKPGKRAKEGKEFSFQNLLSAKVLQIQDDGNRIVRFSYRGDFYSLLDKIGQMPLPPYITETLEDRERYQTVYAKELGSAAAPTAGLHFTEQLLENLRQKGVKIGKVTLHVGLGTFRPVKAEKITDHKMHAEHYELPEETAELIQNVKASGGRVYAVGTTSCRTLESVGAKYGTVRADSGYTDIFLYPGRPFRVIDGLITNFHLPESTLIMLVCAFAGYQHTMRAYEIAVQEKYQFFSFGDAMLID